MKHFAILTEIENEIIRLTELRKLTNVLANGIDTASSDEIVSVFFTLHSMIENISVELDDKFQQLFNAIRNE